MEPWQLRQLERLAQFDPERVETVLNTVWHSYPGLLNELAILAVDQEALSVERCAELCGVDASEVEARLIAFRRRDSRADVVVEGNIARLRDGQVAVWEIVREFRKLGSVERLAETFPTLTHGQLAAAIKYAESHPEEVEDQIQRYERVLEKRRAEYPFAR